MSGEHIFRVMQSEKQRLARTTNVVNSMWKQTITTQKQFKCRYWFWKWNQPRVIPAGKVGSSERSSFWDKIIFSIAVVCRFRFALVCFLTVVTTLIFDWTVECPWIWQVSFAFPDNLILNFCCFVCNSSLSILFLVFSAKELCSVCEWCRLNLKFISCSFLTFFLSSQSFLSVNFLQVKDVVLQIKTVRKPAPQLLCAAEQRSSRWFLFQFRRSLRFRRGSC